MVKKEVKKKIKEVKKEISKKISKDVLLKTALFAVKSAGFFLVKKQKSAKIQVMKKKGDFALDVDISAENLIKKIIKRKFAKHSFLAEESEDIQENDYVWVIDPLDGTLNYANKIPFFSVSIAVLFKGNPIISVVYALMQDELFYAVKGKGAFLNGKRIFVNNKSKKDEVILCGTPSNLYPLNKKINLSMTRYFRCSSLELAYVACGRFAARIKDSFSGDPYGTAPGMLLVTEAGGFITDFDGADCDVFTNKYVASNKVFHKKLLSIMKIK
jgi:myo-inositol-1(or 4)-monophosphatase